MIRQIKRKVTGLPLSISSNRTESIYQKTTLSNGVRVVTESIPHVRSLSIGIWVAAGSRNESPEKNGISHFIEHMVFKGTKKRSIKDIAQSLESLGGYLNAFTSKEHTCFYARILDEHLELSLDVLSDIVFSSTFPQKELSKEKSVVLEEIKQAEDDPSDIIYDYFEKALFKSHPLGMPVLGNEDSILSFTQNDLLKFKSQHYTSNKVLITAAGNICHESVVELAERYLFNVPVTQSIKTINTFVNDKNYNNVEQEFVKPIQQAHICMGTVGYNISHKNRYAMQVLNTLLGDGMSSRLFQNIREKYGFAYAVNSFNTMFSDTGYTGVYIGTDKKHISKCIDIVWKELISLKKNGIKKSELERTKSQLKGSLMLGMENIPNRMIRLGNSEMYFGKMISLDDIIKNIESVTLDEVQNVAEELFKKEKFSTVIFKPNGINELKSE